MQGTNRRSMMIQVGIWIVVVAATVIGLLLFVPALDRGAKFCLTLAAMLFAESMVCGFILWITACRGMNRSSFPAELGVGVVAVGYATIVVVVSLIALTPVSASLIGILHLIAFVLLAAGVGYLWITSGYVERLSTSHADRRTSWTTFNDQLLTLQSRTARIGNSALTPLNMAISALVERVRYATTESSPQSTPLEDKLQELYRNLSRVVDAIAERLNNGDASPDQENMRGATLLVAEMSDIVEQRDRTMKRWTGQR